MTTIKNVLITGGNGLVGSRLTQLLIAKGYNVSHLVRRKSGRKDVNEYLWNVNEKFVEEGAFNSLNAIIHLAGAGIADKPWTDARKKEIIDSRVLSTQLLNEKLKKSSQKIKSFVSASAIGFYGLEKRTEPLRETDGSGKGFLSDCCVQWENAVHEIKPYTDNLSILRIGVVLSEKGGALPKISMPVKLGIGSPLGSGKQIVPWIHLDDLCNMFIFAMEKELSETFNAVSPEITDNSTLTKTVANALRKPYFFPNVPAFAIKLLYGELADLVLLGTAVSSEKIQKSGFQFQFKNLEDAINEIAPRL